MRFFLLVASAAEHCMHHGTCSHTKPAGLLLRHTRSSFRALRDGRNQDTSMLIRLRRTFPRRQCTLPSLAVHELAQPQLSLILYQVLRNGVISLVQVVACGRGVLWLHMQLHRDLARTVTPGCGFQLRPTRLPFQHIPSPPRLDVC